MLTSLGSQMAYFLVHLCKYIRTTPRQAKTLDTQLSTLQYSNPGEGILLVQNNASTDFVALVNTPVTNKVFAKRVGPCNTFICLYVRTCICLFHTFNMRASFQCTGTRWPIKHVSNKNRNEEQGPFPNIFKLDRMLAAATSRRRGRVFPVECLVPATTLSDLELFERSPRGPF